MSRRSLFAHLVNRFAAHPENWATEALAYVLEQSPEAAMAMRSFLRELAADVGVISHWSTQVSADDDSIPDLVGADDTGSTPLIIENKFWAGLTENQPQTYLRRLASNGPGCVLVVAPAVRAEFLWPELTRRAKQVGDVEELRVSHAEARAASVGGIRYLALTSWRLLLNYLGSALSDAGDLAGGSDLKQLAGLCEEMDTHAFLPLRSEELTGAIGSRLVQLHGLVDDSVTRLVEKGIASARDKDGKALFASAGTLYWGRWLNLASVTCMLRVAPMSWAQHRATPIWLQIGFKGSPHVATTMKALEALATDPGRVVSQGTFVDVAIDLPTGVEREAVMGAVIEQVRLVTDLLKTGIQT